MNPTHGLFWTVGMSSRVDVINNVFFAALLALGTIAALGPLLP